MPRKSFFPILFVGLMSLCSFAGDGKEAEVSVKKEFEPSLEIALGFSPEFAWHKRPEMGTSSDYSFGFRPGVGVVSTFKLAPAWDIQFALIWSWMLAPVRSNVVIDGTDGTLISKMNAFSLPATVHHQMKLKGHRFGDLSFAVGPTWQKWTDKKFIDVNLGENAVATPAKSFAGLFLEIGYAHLVRVTENFSFGIGPSAGVSWAGDWGYHVGAAIRFS